MKALRAALRLLGQPCEGMARLSLESLDRKLTGTERFALRIHTLYCTACRRFWAQIKWIRLATKRAIDELEADEFSKARGMPQELRDRLNRLTRES